MHDSLRGLRREVQQLRCRLRDMQALYDLLKRGSVLRDLRDLQQLQYRLLLWKALRGVRRSMSHLR